MRESIGADLERTIDHDRVHGPKVDVEEVPVGTEQEIVEVAIADAEQIGDNAVPSTALHISAREREHHR